MKDILLAYIAGCLDCDGSFGIRRTTYGIRVMKDCTNPSYYPRILFAQTKPEVPALLKEHFGGTYQAESKSYNPNWKPVYRWEVGHHKAAILAKSVLPHLRIKRKQAEIILELDEMNQSPRVKVGTFIITNRWGKEIVMPRRRVSSEVIQAKEDLYKRITALNSGHRGIRAEDKEVMKNGE